MRQQQPSAMKGLGVAAAALACLAIGAGAFIYVKNSSRKSADKLEESLKYNPAPLRKVDTKLIRYRPLGEIDTGLKAPTSLAIGPKGEMFVGGDQEVRLLSLEGKVRQRITLADRPTCLAVAADGTIFVGLKDHVELYDAAGTKKATWPTMETGAYLTSIALHGNDVWLADAGRRLVMGCDRDGRIFAELGKGKLLVPSPHLDVAIANDGTVWLANPGQHWMESYTRMGEPKAKWGEGGDSPEKFAGCCNPSDFALLANGNIVTSEKGSSRVKVYTADGKLDCVVADASMLGEGDVAMDLAIDAKGRVIVLDPTKRVVRIFVRKEGSGS